MRQLATRRIISSLKPIEGADNIELVTVDGWNVVVKKGDFNPGDPCIYFEIDSFLPEADTRYSFLMNKGVKTFEGNRGHVLRTIKLRGQISQGLVLPVSAFPELDKQATDLDDILGIKKYEPPIHASLSGQVKGSFPWFIPKTDQERCQNLVDDIFKKNFYSLFEITIKMDGTSCTVYKNDGVIGVCSRNLEMTISDDNKDNTYIKATEKLREHLKGVDRNIAIQMEIMGPGIQGNPEKLQNHKCFIFDVWDIDSRRYLTEKEQYCDSLGLYDFFSRYSFELFDWAPRLYSDLFSLYYLEIDSIDSLLRLASGPSLNAPIREGLVFKRVDGRFSFKVINNEYLL